jgi:hypothetical protein
MEAVLSVRKLAEDGFFHIHTILEKEEHLRRGHRPWVSWGKCYKEREKEAQKAAREVFDAFLQIATKNRALIDASPVAWAYGQTESLLHEEFGVAQSWQEFGKIKHWLKEYCDGKDHSPIPALESDQDWKEYLCRESWQAPMWLKIAASRHFGNDTSAWNDRDETSAFQRLDKEETEALLGGICRWFWSAVTAALENKARLASIGLASQAAVESITGGSQAFPIHETNGPAVQTMEKQTSVDPDELSKGVSEGKTVHLLYGQLKRIRRLYREKGWSTSQIRQNTYHDLSVSWEWIDRVGDVSRRTDFLKISHWDNGDGFIFRQIATLYEYAPHLSKKPSWSTVRDWRKAFLGYVRHQTPNGRKPRP